MWRWSSALGRCWMNGDRFTGCGSAAELGFVFHDTRYGVGFRILFWRNCLRFGLSGGLGIQVHLEMGPGVTVLTSVPG